MNDINKTYSNEYCNQLELAYGDGMMSDGGHQAIEETFIKIELNNKKALDFGSGLGGVAFYLASKYNTKVEGVEINPGMIKTAVSKRPFELRDLVNFSLIKENQLLDFPDNHFDIIYSRGVIVHLSDLQREITFKEFYRVLKPQGVLVIYDWLSAVDNSWSDEVKELSETESLPLYAHSPKSYINNLNSHGFKDIIFSDQSLKAAKYNQDVIDNLLSEKIKNQFIEKYGEITFKEHLTGYKNIRDVNKSGKAISALFTASK